eukprot:42225-Eustigmatos_ZCMA.PRE.1
MGCRRRADILMYITTGPCILQGRESCESLRRCLVVGLGWFAVVHGTCGTALEDVCIAEKKSKPKVLGYQKVCDTSASRHGPIR